MTLLIKSQKTIWFLWDFEYITTPIAHDIYRHWMNDRDSNHIMIFGIRIITWTTYRK